MKHRCKQWQRGLHHQKVGRVPSLGKKKNTIFSLNLWGFLTRNYVPEKKKRWRFSNMRSFPPFFEGNVDEKEISLIACTLFHMLIWVTCGVAALPSFGWAEKTKIHFTRGSRFERLFMCAWHTANCWFCHANANPVFSFSSSCQMPLRWQSNIQ